MDKNRIKKFAIWARTELIMRVTQRAYYYGVDGESQPNPEAREINGRLFTEDECRKRRKLVQRVQKKGFQPVMEEAAYTWFNRFAALRYMEVNGVLPTRVRVFSSREGAFAPQILDECLTMENLEGLDKSVLFDLKEKDATEELYKYLLITQCNALGSILPVMFRQIEDYTELLLPDNLLREGSVIHQLVTEIEEEDWRDAVQMIGWLYQYYNSEPKDAVFAALKKNIKVSKENIPAATQLFTPDWIVRYMVENSLGRLWLEGHHPELIPLPWRGGAEGAGVVSEGDVSPLNHPVLTGTPPQEGNRLLHEWKYYLPEAPQDTEVAAKLQELRASRADLRPEDIKLIDPCMGSGHILVYAFDVLVQIYKDAGYREKDIPELILKHNLYGLDIDDRAYQLAYFAVMMRAWNYNHRILVKRIEPNLCAIQESNGLGKWSELNMDMSGTQQLNLESQFVQLADELIEKFQDAKEYGSILDVEEKNYGALLTYIKELQENSVLDLSMAAWLHEVGERLPGLVKQAQIMGQKYDIVVTNPPYMGNMPIKMTEYVQLNYEKYKYDLYSVIVKKAIEMLKNDGYISVITQHTWMFISSFNVMRRELLKKRFVNILHLGTRAFDEISGEVVQTAAIVWQKSPLSKVNIIADRLVDFSPSEMKKKAFLNKEDRYITSQENLNYLPEKVLAYWLPQKYFSILKENKKIDNYVERKAGVVTGNDGYFIRLWYEANWKDICLKARHKGNYSKYHIMQKGGGARRFFGNYEYIIKLSDLWNPNKTNKSVRRGDEEYYFAKAIGWSQVGNSRKTFRLVKNSICGTATPTIYLKDDSLFYYVLGFLNTKIAYDYLEAYNPTINLLTTDICNLPIIIAEDNREKIDNLVEILFEISKCDWDSFETSWDFKCHPLIPLPWRGGAEGDGVVTESTFSAGDHPGLTATPPQEGNGGRLADCYEAYKQVTNKCFDTLKKNEEELNRIFIDIYGLSDELTPDVADKDVTVARIYDTKEEIPDSMKGNNYVLTREDVVKSLISYAVGCMFGRYSLDEPGLICAGGEFDPSKYETYHPDEDAIIPICDDEYFEDDIVERFCIWLKAAFGEEHYRENLQFIADALEGKGTPLETIRSYFLSDFYTDHCKRYQKRPIYWLFDAGKKNSFKALVYIHRYDKDTIARMRTGYVYKQQELYKTRIETTQNRIDTAASQADKNKFKRDLKKLREQFDEIHVYEEKIHHYADLRQEIDLDDGVKHNYALFADILAKIK